jgi:hypothetical protein
MLGALSGDFESRHSKAANQAKQPDWDGRTRFACEMRFPLLGISPKYVRSAEEVPQCIGEW